MATVKEDQFKVMQKVLGIPGSQLSGATEVDLDSAQQTLPLIPNIVRRGVQLGPTEGWFQGVLENVHSAADGENSAIDPYKPGASAQNAFPAIVPEGWDVWLHGACVVRISGAGDLDATGEGALLALNSGIDKLAWGEDDAGDPVTTHPLWYLKRWTKIVEGISATASEDPARDDFGVMYHTVNMRMPRGIKITFKTESDAAATFQLNMILGVFPTAMGQDIAG